MSREDRQAAELLAREVRDLMAMGVPKHLPFDQWLAEYFLRFLADRVHAAGEIVLERCDHDGGPLTCDYCAETARLMATGRGQATPKQGGGS